MTLLALLSSAAWACPVCGAASSSMNQGEYLVMTIVLSLLPLAMGAGIVAWVVRSASAQPDPTQAATNDS